MDVYAFLKAIFLILACFSSVLRLYIFSKTCTAKGERGIGSDIQLCGGQKVIKIGPHLCILSHTCLIKHMEPFVMRGQLTESWETSALKSRVLKCPVAVPGVSFTVLGQSPSTGFFCHRTVGVNEQYNKFVSLTEGSVIDSFGVSLSLRNQTGGCESDFSDSSCLILIQEHLAFLRFLLSFIFSTKDQRGSRRPMTNDDYPIRPITKPRNELNRPQVKTG